MYAKYAQRLQRSINEGWSLKPYCRPTFSSYWSYDYGPTTARERASDRDYRLYSLGRATDRHDGRRSPEEEERRDAAVLEKEKEKEKEEKERELVKVIHVKSVDLHVEENSKRHHTDKYECTQAEEGETPELVIRRGDNFLISVTFNRPYNKATDNLKLVFTSGDNPLPKLKNSATVLLNEEKKKNEGRDWNAVIVSSKDSTLTLSVHVAPDCVIGEWRFTVKSILEDKDGGEAKIFRYQVDPGLTILLNPWCPEDEVYYPVASGLDEYVLNDAGALFYGNYRQIGGRSWNFGQFEKGILEICLHLVRKSLGGNVDANMADPVQIARGISKIVNDCDDNGVLTGRWDGEYEDGVRPTKWCGSVKILQQYDRSGKPVKYGQCWVFSALTTTVCRAIGMPCRSVTNFASAHDTDVSLTIDTVYAIDRDGIPTKTHLSGDSVWNFHVWNEVWMERRQMAKEYSGWQALDATPQERSDGYYVCGPCPIEAIKRGDVTVPYDAPFIFAEVNADFIDWVMMADDPDELYVMSVNKSKIGRKISTKKPTGEAYDGALSVFGDDPQREDLTLAYKYEEGRREEREAVARAVAFSSVKRPDYESHTPIKLSLEDKDKVVVGEAFTYKAEVTNSHAKDSRTVDCVMVIKACRYTGSEEQTIKAEHFPSLTLKPGQKEGLSVTVVPAEYMGKLPEGFAMEVELFALVKEDRVYVNTSDQFRLRRPDLDITGPRSVKRKQEFEVRVRLTNPLDTPLTQCRLTFEGTLLPLDGQDDLDCGTVAAKDTKEIILKMKPKAKPFHVIARNMSVSFDCFELPDITGYYRVILTD